MATKERLHKLIDDLPETPDTERKLKAAEHQLDPPEEPEMAPAPAGWGWDKTAWGDPMPNVVAWVNQSRAER